jgi:hypothetical protein
LVVAVAGRRLASVAEITVVRAGVERLDELVGFWKLLHRHQSSVATAVPGLDIRLAQQPIELGPLLMCAPYPGG